MKKKAIIIGINGQDGFYLSELLLNKNYIIYGITNRLKKTDRIKNNKKNLKIIKLSINNYKDISNFIKKTKPTEVYHLGSKSYINYEFDKEFFKLNPSINGTNFILTSIKNFSPKTKFACALL